MNKSLYSTEWIGWKIGWNIMGTIGVIAVLVVCLGILAYKLYLPGWLDKMRQQAIDNNRQILITR